MKSNSSDTEAKPLLTTTRLLAIFFVQVNEAYQISVLLPLVVFMCRDFGISPKWLGVYSSLLNASFSSCQFCVCYFWGLMSDIYGRKNALICGLVGSCISMIVFGFSTSYEMALISRSVTGLFCGNLGVLKAYLADITDSSNRGYAFTIIGVAYGVAMILGSMLRGILIYTNDVDAPDDLYIKTTSILKWSIFEHRFPYMLPTSVCGGFVALNALIWTLLFVKEFKQTKRTSIYNEDALDIASDIEMASTLTAPTCTFTDIAYNSTSPLTSTEIYGFRYTHAVERIPIHHSLPSYHEIKAMVSSFEATADKQHLLSNVRGFNKSIDERHGTVELNSVLDLLKYTKLSHALLAYGSTAIVWFMFKEMGPVFMAQALCFNSAYIGYTQAWSGIVYFAFCILIQPVLLRKFDHHGMVLIFICITVLSVILMPSTYWFTLMDHQKLNFMDDGLWLLCLVFIAELFFTAGIGIIFTIATCWVNNSVPSKHVGKVNGAGQTLSSFVRGVGPMLTGFIWSESVVQMDYGVHYAVYLAYLPMAIFYIIAFVDIAAYIPHNLQLIWEEQENTNSQKT